jgi:hypothetical protein
MAAPKKPENIKWDAEVDGDDDPVAAEPRTGRATKVAGPNSTFAERAKAAGRNKRVASGESK